MNGYRTVVVGTDGSDSSLRAVDRAGEIAAAANAQLFVATAYLPHSVDTKDANALKGEAYKLAGNAWVYALLRDARDRAKEAGAADIKERAIKGTPVHALVELAKEVNADLLVVGNVGMNSITGRLLGSVPASIAHKTKTDVLIVHTIS